MYMRPAAGDHIAVLPNQNHLMVSIEELAEELGLSMSAEAGKANLDTPFDLEVFANLPPSALEGLDFG